MIGRAKRSRYPFQWQIKGRNWGDEFRASCSYDISTLCLPASTHFDSCEFGRKYAACIPLALNIGDRYKNGAAQGLAVL